MRRDLMVVIHLTSPSHAAEQSSTAIEAGADGVFLINHNDGHDILLDSVAETRSRLGDSAWIGINPLGLDCVEAAAFVRLVNGAAGRVDGLWCDNAEIDEDRDPLDQPRARLAQEKRRGWGGLYFGGVAFKYQRSVDDEARAARAAVLTMEVVCTSGPGTGRAAETAKLEAMHRGVNGGARLAVASGVTVDNVEDQLPYCDYFLVATGVSHSFTELDPQRIRALAAVIHGFD